MISALLVATHIINFQGNLRKFVKDLSGPTHPTTQYSGLLDCFPLAKMHTKGCFGHNRKYFCGDFSTLTRKLTKDGYLSQSKKPFFIQFFGKTKAFT